MKKKIFVISLMVVLMLAFIVPSVKAAPAKNTYDEEEELVSCHDKRKKREQLAIIIERNEIKRRLCRENNYSNYQDLFITKLDFTEYKESDFVYENYTFKKAIHDKYELQLNYFGNTDGGHTKINGYGFFKINNQKNKILPSSESNSFISIKRSYINCRYSSFVQISPYCFSSKVVLSEVAFPTPLISILFL